MDMTLTALDTELRDQQQERVQYWERVLQPRCRLRYCRGQLQCLPMLRMPLKVTQQLVMVGALLVDE